MKRKKVKIYGTLIKGGKVSIKSHSRRTRGGRRIVVKSYSRRAGSKKRGSKKSGKEFETLKNTSPYEKRADERLHTFQGTDEDMGFNFKKTIGDAITNYKRKLRKHASKKKDLNKVEKVLDKFMKKHGYSYKKYL